MIEKMAVKTFFNDVLRAYWVLVKIMVPALLLVKLMQYLGLVELLGYVLEPLMGLIGLPPEFGLVWAAGILTNIYTAMAVFYELSDGNVYTVAQMSVLGVLLLLAHALPVEGAVAKAVGVPWLFTITLRVVGGFVLGWLSYATYSVANLGEKAVDLVWRPDPAAEGLLAWFGEQALLFISIFFILASLMALLRILKWIGVENYLHILLKPLMMLLRVGKEAGNVIIVGLLLGLSFGAGLLIAESKTGRIPKRDMKVVICFLGLCHSVIEDTLLIMLLGADIYAVLWGRLIFTLVVMAIMVRLMPHSAKTKA